VPSIGLIAFVICLFWNVYEEQYDKSEFDEKYFMETAGLEPDAKPKKADPDAAEQKAVGETELVQE
jgi:hypothetical protein